MDEQKQIKKHAAFVVMKESMSTITDYLLLVKNVQVYDVLNTIKKIRKK